MHGYIVDPLFNFEAKMNSSAVDVDKKPLSRGGSEDPLAYVTIYTVVILDIVEWCTSTNNPVRNLNDKKGRAG